MAGLGPAGGDDSAGAASPLLGDTGSPTAGLLPPAPTSVRGWLTRGKGAPCRREPPPPPHPHSHTPRCATGRSWALGQRPRRRGGRRRPLRGPGPTAPGLGRRAEPRRNWGPRKGSRVGSEELGTEASELEPRSLDLEMSSVRWALPEAPGCEQRRNVNRLHRAAWPSGHFPPPPALSWEEVSLAGKGEDGGEGVAFWGAVSETGGPVRKRSSRSSWMNLFQYVCPLRSWAWETAACDMPTGAGRGTNTPSRSVYRDGTSV